MHRSVKERLPELERRIGHSFKDSLLLYEAVTHRSALVELRPAAGDEEPLPWNERLEFLGDSVLSLAVSQRLMDREEIYSEGELSRIRAALVNEESLAEVARAIELGECLALGRGEERAGARERDSLLADAFEALLGAIFLDAGFEVADAVVGRLFASQLARDVTLLVQMDYKTILQELTQDRSRVTPTYEVVGTSGPDHEKEFEVICLIAGKEMGRGKGASKKRASQAAAREALERVLASERLAKHPKPLQEEPC